MRTYLPPLLIAGLLMSVMATAGSAQVDFLGHPTGNRPPTREELERDAREMVRLQSIRPNQIGLDRINEHRRGKGLRALTADEVGLVRKGREIVGRRGAAAMSGTPEMPSMPGAEVAPMTETEVIVANSLPGYVDNSKLPYFPSIFLQTGGSCSAASTTYYQMTHMVAMVHDWDVTNPSDNSVKFSPMWTYSMLNGGVDDGVWPSSCVYMMMKHGAATWTDQPGTNLYKWALEGDIYRRAINYRLESYGTISNATSAASMTQLKTMLNNGYVLNFSTYINSWQYTKIKDDPSTSADDEFVGRDVAFWVNGVNGFHAMTIVGYCDDIWTDVNGNGVVDAGEKGAFRIANSHGTSFREAGFTWFAYDGLRAVSAVPGAPTLNRRSGWYKDEALWMTPRVRYRPKLIAEFSMHHASRREIRAQLGISSTGSTSPSQWWTPDMIYAHGGTRAFDGTTTACNGTFAFDFTDLAPAIGQARRYYFGVADSASGNPTTVTAYKLTDLVHGNEVACTNLPLVVDSQSQPQTVYVQHPFSGNQIPVAHAGSNFAVYDNGYGGTVSFSLDGTASTDADGTIVSYVWTLHGQPLATGVSPQVALPVGIHPVMLTVTDDLGASSSDTVRVTVHPPADSLILPIAASADDTWATSTSNSYTSTVSYLPGFNNSRRAFIRWSLPIPRNAVITSAYVRVRSTGAAGNASPAVVQLQMVDSDNCPSLSSNPFDWPVSGPTLNWTMPGPWNISAWHTSGDIKQLVQSFVDRPNYQPSRYFGLRGLYVSGSHKTIYQRDASINNAPILTISYIPAAPAVAEWHVLTDHGAAGLLPAEAQDGYVNASLNGFQTLKLTFTTAVDPATVNAGSISIVGQANGNQSALISQVTLEAGGTVLVLQLLAALPDADSYTLTLDDNVRAADGSEIGGNKSLTIAMLAADVDGSGKVTSADVLAVRAAAGKAAADGGARYDVDGSGMVTGADMRAVQARIGNALP